jgi:alcohol dehydrogenase
MKAAVLKALGAPQVIETIPDPVPGTGEVVIDVAASRVLPYAGEVLSGQRNYVFDLPMVPGPGAIGRVRHVGPDATHLKVGDWVSCDPTVRSRDNAQAPDILLQGLTAPSDGARKLHRHFHDGAWAEQVMVPTENVKPLGDIAAGDAARWSAIGTLLVPYGGLLAAGLEAGETLLVSGATGNFGSATIAVALAMGAAWVIAPGRNSAALADLERRFAPRVRTVQLRGDEAADRAAMLAAAPGPIDVAFDILPPQAPPTAVRAAVMTVRGQGRVVLMGGVGMQAGPGLELPYDWIMRNNITIHGAFMYPPDAMLKMIALIRAGLISLDQFEVTTFPLVEANTAVAFAAANGGPFKATAICP